VSTRQPTPPTAAAGARKDKTPIIPPEEQPPPPLEPGDRVGNYTIVTKIGDGGMGSVYKAKQIHTGAFAAVKVLHAKYARHEQITKRLKDEARAASSLQHPNIVTVHDVGQRETGEWYLILQYLDGSPLTKTIASWGGPMDLETMMRIAAQVASGVAKAHKAGIIHRDLKPENLFLTQRDNNERHVTILDFGVARVPSADGKEGDTQTGVILGTPTYMAPEQLRGHKVDHRIDIYALGVILWETSTGRRLWEGSKGPADIGVMQASNARPLNPCAIIPALPAAWGAAIERALAIKPEDRFPTMGDFVRALAHAMPPTPWSPNGVAILTEHAKELAKVDADALTAGRATNRASEPTVRVVADAAPSSFPDIALTPAPAVNPNAVSRSAVTALDAPPMSPPVALASPQEPTTFGGATGQRTPMPSTSSRRRIVMIGAGATVGVVIAAIIAANSEDDSERGPSVDPSPVSAVSTSTSALAIITEPDGAAVTIDGTARGHTPLNIVATVGHEIEIRAELANHAQAVERVRVGATPSTLRLSLVPLADAAVAAPIDAPAAVDAAPAPRGPTSGRRRTAKPPANGSGPWNPDDVVDP